ncbi:MAG: hypothetical protein V3R14_01875 [Nitrospinaceae bacterium]
MRWMVLILGFSLSGCIIAPYEARYQQPRYQGPAPLQTTSIEQVNAMVGVQQPAAYKVGFMGGCDSGHLSAGETSFIFKKDTARFDTDDAYKQGWNDGFNRCVSGTGVTVDNYNRGYYGYNYYYPNTYYSGFYYPSYSYAPGYSLWLGYYGYPRHRHYAYNHNHHYTPWYGGHKHRGRGFKGYSRGHHLSKPRGGGGHSKGFKGGHGKGRKGGHGKGRGGRGGLGPIR